jgi:hypothetical protein
MQIEKQLKSLKKLFPWRFLLTDELDFLFNKKIDLT